MPETKNSALFAFTPDSSGRIPSSTLSQRRPRTCIHSLAMIFTQAALKLSW